MLYTSSVINVVGINANGIRSKRKRLLLHKLLIEIKAGVRIVTETHMRKSELRGLKIEDYYIQGQYCRDTPLGERIGGGVLILIHRGISTAKIAQLKGMEPEIEHCIVRLFPTDDPITEMRIVGVYIPPGKTRTLTRDKLFRLSEPVNNKHTEDTTPMLIVGDLNITSWEELYAEWINEVGLQELVDPEIPTFALGSSLDKILFMPGYYIPSTFLLPEDSRFLDRSGIWEEPYYPAEVLNYPHFSDHSPVMLPIPSDAKKGKEMTERSMRVGDLSEEDWQARDEKTQEILAKKLPEGVTGTEADFNSTRYHDILVRTIREVFTEENKKP